MTPSGTSSGIDQSTFEPQSRPQDDLFRHVNGRWLDENEIPADRASVGSFIDLRDASELAVREIIETAAANADGAPLEKKIGDLYASFMNEEVVNAAGIAPLTDTLRAVYATQSAKDLLTLAAKLQRGETSGPIGFYVYNDPGDPTRYLFQVYQSGLGLPDEAYYREEKSAELRQKYQQHVAKMLGLAGVAEDEAAAERVMALETALAEGHWDNVTLRDPQKTYNLLSRDAATELFSGLGSWLDALGVSEQQSAEIVVQNPDFLRTLETALAEQPLQAWQDWLAMRVISSAAPYLSENIVAENFAFYGTALSGTTEIRERWKRGVALVEGGLGEALGQLYVAQHFPPAHKERMETLVAGLIEAYRESISSLEWMGEETKAKALEKLGKFVPKIGYPNVWRDYSELEISAADLLGNVQRANLFELNRQLARIGQPIDREEWLMTPQTVNAYYNPTMNEIVFPAAILQPPFFDAGADDAANFGGIGAVIGHEIGHGFDDQGSQFDGEGALNNWWTDQDRSAFEERTAKLVAQYDALSPVAAPEHRLNGKLTLGENIGDLGGLSIAYAAWQLALDGTSAEDIDELSGTERFFYSWAQCWRGKSRPEEAIRRVSTDPHSAAEWRCNQVVKNLDTFHQTFGTTETDELWLDPAARVRIW
ncbi:putative endopeptidase [Psychromicrobium silvestre]|uniref:Putative endopeptidase n=1 Tax=Psychromicrobium silvestre TaxID=1645614 RepID=A0A7Y9S599_9MICC|nr:M13-type metalloendopeptidase [Psychromicrobium silvestre]NYE94385.1 putative endopeptidase [Psychromicrobium silvestre]